MQDHRHQLRGDRKGVADLPIKLLVIMVVLCVAIPVVAEAADRSQKSILSNQLESESNKIVDTVAVVYYSGSGSSRTLEIDLPQGCEIVIGGEGTDAYAIKSYGNGELLSVRHLENPSIAFNEKIIIDGDCELKVSCHENNEVRMEII